MITGPVGHPDPEQLDSLLDPAETPRRSEQLRAHVAACGPCSARLHDLRRVRSMLHAARDTVAMPDELTERIRSALLAENGRREEAGSAARTDRFDDDVPVFDVPLGGGSGSAAQRGGGSGSAQPGGEVVQLTSRRRRSPLVWLGAAAAAVLAVGVGGGIVADQFLNSGISADVAAVAPSTSSGHDLGSGRMPNEAAAAEAGPDSAEAFGSAPDRDAPQAVTGDLDPASLPEAVRQQRANAAGSLNLQPTRGPAGAPLAAVAPTCAEQLGLAPDTPVFPAHWEGRAAIVFLSPLPTGAVDVVDADCHAGAAGQGFHYQTTVND